MSELSDKLVTSARNDQLDEPRYSRKTKRVIVCVKECNFSIPLSRLDEAIDVTTPLSDGTGPLQSLLDGLLHARQKYGHIIAGKKKLRGIQAGRKDIFYTLKYAGAWTYIVVKDQMSQPAEKRLSALQVAEKKLESDIPYWSRLMPFERVIYLTASLVEDAYGIERRKEGLKKREGLEPRDWYRDYIQPYLSDVRRRAQKRLKPLSHHSNAYLRQVFAQRNV